MARRFVEHGEYEKSYYGTSLEAIRSVVSLEKICVLNLHPQSLKILKSSDLVSLGGPSNGVCTIQLEKKYSEDLNKWSHWNTVRI